ncbi:glycosyl hydrolase family 32 [Coraliomargarita sp. W4R53]
MIKLPKIHVFIFAVAGFCLAGYGIVSAEEAKGERLYNGIVLPETWPPTDIDPTSREPMPVPYLESPPELIPIDVGRQLFVDDFLIESTDLERHFHFPVKYEGNPVLKAETDLEHLSPTGPFGTRSGATPKSGGLWWSPEKKIFELWYEAGWLGTIAYAYSHDGIHWERPNLDVVPGTNQVLPQGIRPDSWTVVRDWWTDDPEARFKMFMRRPGGGHGSGASCFVSADGLEWGDDVMSGPMGDRSTAHYNPFRDKWVFSIRSSFQGRSRHYWEGDDFMRDNQWELDEAGYRKGAWREGQPVVWAMADRLDLPDPKLGYTTQLYNLDAVAYESIMLGFFQVWRGPHNHDSGGVPKITELSFAYSRDGFHWDRPDRSTAIASERVEGTWDRGYVQSLGNIGVIRGDELWIYYAGFAGDDSLAEHNQGMYSNSAMGLAKMRRDGFASMDAETQGGLMTRPVIFSGSHLFVNAEVQGGLRVEIRDEEGVPIEPFTLANSIPMQGDHTLEAMRWKGGNDLGHLAEKPVRFYFELNEGALYAFWVSQDLSGRSDGYVAGSGPGYTGGVDTVGRAALQADEQQRNEQ